VYLDGHFYGLRKKDDEEEDGDDKSIPMVYEFLYF